MDILIMDCDVARALALGDHLIASGHSVSFARTARNGLLLSRRVPFDAMVIARDLSDMQGVELVKRLRERGDDALVMIIGEGAGVGEVVMGISAGADDYRAQRTDALEIAARLSSMMQRGRTCHVVEAVSVAGLCLDMRSCTLTRADTPIDITRTQAKVLKELMVAAPCPVTFRRLEQVIWGGRVHDPGLLRAHVSSLRRRVDRPFGTRLIRTHIKFGYSIGG